MNEVIVALATPAGRGALGIVRLSGPGCFEVGAAFLEARLPLVQWRPREAVLASVRGPEGELLDEALAVKFPGKASFCGEDTLEITAHGSPYILDRILEAARRHGARLAQPGEFTRRAFENGKLDLAQAEAVQRLIAAETRLSHRAALRQKRGHLSKAMEDFRERLLDAVARIEVQLDHDEEDLAGVRTGVSEEALGALESRLQELLEQGERGRLRSAGFRVAVVGAPNAGKSSLLNAVLGEERAITADRPGTTRDTLEERADLDGLQTVWIDTAGVRSGKLDPVEKEGIRRAKLAAEAADAVIWVLDRSKPWSDSDARVLKEIVSRREAGDAVAVLNKCDLPDRLRAPRDLTETVSLSAIDRSTLGPLVQKLHRLSGVDGDANEADGIVEKRHREAVSRAREATHQARLRMAEGHPELCAASLRTAVRAVGEVVGEVDSEEILGAIFSRFCLGK